MEISIGKKPSILFLHAAVFTADFGSDSNSIDRSSRYCSRLKRPWTKFRTFVLWSILAQDISKLIQGLEIKAVIGVGHSGITHLLSAARLPDIFNHLLLLDPYSSPEFYLSTKSPENFPRFFRGSVNSSPSRK